MTLSRQFEPHYHILNLDNVAVQQEHAMVVLQQHCNNFGITSQSTTMVHDDGGAWQQPLKTI
jgi:hypothetical protein